MGSNQDNFQLHRFTTSENIAESFRGRGGYFLTRTVVVGGEVIKKNLKQKPENLTSLKVVKNL